MPKREIEWIPHPGIEPGAARWKRAMLTPTLMRMFALLAVDERGGRKRKYIPQKKRVWSVADLKPSIIRQIHVYMGLGHRNLEVCRFMHDTSRNTYMFLLQHNARWKLLRGSWLSKYRDVVSFWWDVGGGTCVSIHVFRGYVTVNKAQPHQSLTTIGLVILVIITASRDNWQTTVIQAYSVFNCDFRPIWCSRGMPYTPL